ncbi:ABC transporter substrate-binding protein [Thalassotalea sp. 1_MG-2023]|uniref:ABC transporter substrate-binding protein n=1 Tax=Thalassotalea sp. 1_MG-2023 TaxID=3062680 RepID=UPI0026E2A4E4|nr:ABC transporter substrate-binding protein [Thalassotalea sp. 1_MG-2023]MDO6426018.1 ABC transporter substrate-binding protein [Thalassotalea sp. 1_MG-2023]
MKHRWRKAFMVIAALGCVLILLLKYIDDEKVAQHQTIDIAVSLTPLSAPLYVAKAINAFDKQCVSVNIIDVVGGKRAFDLVESGQVNYATTSDSVIAFQSLNRPPIVSHAMFVHSDNDIKLLSKHSSQVEKITDLAGKKVGLTLKTAGEYFFTALLALEGLTYTDIIIKNYSPDHLHNALETGEVDVIVSWEPYAFQTIQTLNEKIKVHQTKNLNSLSFNLISTNTQAQDVATTQCLLAGLIKATEFIAVQPKKAKAIVKNKLNVDQAFIDWVWRDYIFKVGLDNSLLLSIESQAMWAYEQHLSSQNNKTLMANNQYRHYIDTRALSEINPRLVNVYF